MVALATTYEEYISLLAAESPIALILTEWWRLNNGLRQYFKLVRGREAKGSHELEQLIAEHHKLGPNVSEQIAVLRRRRNRLVHKDTASPSPDEAISYARRVYEVIKELTSNWTMVLN